jgi:hypothetical protein
MVTLVTLRAADQAGLDVLPEHDAYLDVEEHRMPATRRRD